MARGACGYIQAIPMVMHSFHACVYFVVGFSFHWSHMTVHASRFTALRLLVQSLNHTNKKHHQTTFWPFVWGINWWQIDLPAQMASDAQSISISWRHHGLALCCFTVIWYRSISPMSFSVTSLSLRLYPTASEAVLTWWRHQMEAFSALLAICAGNSPVPGEFPAQRPVTRSFDVFFDLRLNQRLSKQWWGWWFETLPRPLWRHCNEGHYICLPYISGCLHRHWGNAWMSMNQAWRTLVNKPYVSARVWIYKTKQSRIVHFSWVILQQSTLEFAISGKTCPWTR